ncbi:MAG: hypothetical protein SCM11_14130, partial [Bacillota bacterium]|nr:hypothetical protein [Bacillota bacterium]
MKTMKNLRNLTLEVSLKPFWDTAPAAMEAVARQIFTQWGTLIRHADQVSVLLWTADGSEILDYSGDLDEPFDWARYMGCCNGKNGPLIDAKPDGPGSLNSGYYLYMKCPPVYTYRMLRDLVALLRRVGEEMTGKPVRIGETFDPGPEFADSAFKYERHPEINTSYLEGDQFWFLCSYSVLHADQRKYAGFPNGIEEGTTIGTFLGRQCRHFLPDMGFDYLWLSNGLGFGLEPWKCTGELFDGTRFYPEKAVKARTDITNFWTQFRRECPDVRIETRGTNMGVGIDIATDGISFKDLYNGGFNFQPPPNSPWAAIDGDFGLELTGYMSRIAELPPGEEFPYRFYSHDPWWVNSPWIDRYEGQAHDIYMPLALSRIDGAGRVSGPTSLSFLSIDNTLGGLPDCVPDEISPHMIRAFTNAPDAPAPLVWLYPFGEYDELGKKEKRLGKMYFEDWYMRSAVNLGLPLSAVVSSDNFIQSIAADKTMYCGSILMMPVPLCDSPVEKAICTFVENGGKVVLYGSLQDAGTELMTMLGMTGAEPLSGTFELSVDLLPVDQLERPYPNCFFHDPLLSDGGLAVLPAGHDPSVKVLAWATQDEERRVICSERSLPDWQGGQVVWLRGTCSNTVIPGKSLPKPHDPIQYFPMESLARLALSRFGYLLCVKKMNPEQRNPAVMIHRCENAFYFSGYNPDTTIELKLRFPLGAPMLIGRETWLRDGCSHYQLPRSWQHECRLFVDQKNSDVPLSCIEDTPRDNRYCRHIRIRGLNQATVYIFPYPGFEKRVNITCGV